MTNTLRRSSALLTLLVVFLFCHSAHAYSWMIRRGYTACNTCHSDPSGSGLLTEYGRAQSDELLRTHYGKASGDTSPLAGFAWGVVKPPEWLLLGGQARTLFMGLKIGDAKTTPSFLLMQADLQAEARVKGFRVNASVGAAPTDGSHASVAGAFISREHWVGYGPSDDSVLVRVGRMNLPFALRSIEHELFVRKSTRTDINDTQSHGVAFAYTGNWLRAEVMAIAGNYQIAPDAFRERGYSASAEVTPLEGFAGGVSSLITHAESDLYLRVPNTRHAHGLFARWSPWQPLVLTGEANLLAQHAPQLRHSTLYGSATLLQADLEPIQGLHVIVSGETATKVVEPQGTTLAYSPGQPTTSYGAWFGAQWFFTLHADVRVDVMERSLVAGPTRIPVAAYMAQLHLSL
jgi:hypothetical protein